MNRPYELDQSQIDKFYEDGFLLLDFTIDLSLIDQALRDMQTLHKKKPKKKGSESRTAGSSAKPSMNLLPKKMFCTVWIKFMAAGHYHSRR
jgi:hypothetical protein